VCVRAAPVCICVGEARARVHVALARNSHVLELEVAMHNADAVQVAQALHEFARYAQAVRHDRRPGGAHRARGRLRCARRAHAGEEW
jgi:hypothetical protein